MNDQSPSHYTLFCCSLQSKLKTLLWLEWSVVGHGCHTCTVEQAEMEYCGTTSFFMRVLLDKKYALPYRVVDALVGAWSWRG